MIKRKQHLLFGGLLILLLVTASRLSAGEPPRQEYYEIRIYHLESQEQERRVDQFLKDAFIPALHRAKIEHIGVFKPIENTTDRKIVVLIPYSSLEEMEELEARLAKDDVFASKGENFLETAYDNPAYKRIEKILLKAFPKMPKMELPQLNVPASERLYELRSYEGPSEKIFRNKVKMFNEGNEVGIFKRLGFNAVFYAEVLAGSNMPNLMYMTAFSGKDSREKHWEAFRSDSEWKKLSSMDKYQNNVSHSDTFFLKPTDYSDI